VVQRFKAPQQARFWPAGAERCGKAENIAALAAEAKDPWITLILKTV